MLSGDRIIGAVRDSEVRTILTVPDRSTEEGLLGPISRDPGFRHVRVCKEDEALGISAALSYSKQRALILIQYTGLLDSLNAVRAVAVEYKMPICMMVGLHGKEPDVAPTASRNYGIRIIEPILDAMGIAHHLVDTDRDVERIGPAIETAYATSNPVALLIGRRPVAP
tara:strand:- start:9351 stop:9854 length:504 start_codon:yes stop_codon:yes gene_type:complete